MSYTAYATTANYEALGLPTFEGLETALRLASRHIDSLTFSRIVETGFENLTLFQQELIREIVCRQTLFEHQNEDLIEAALASYAINGVSMQFSSGWNLVTQSGVAMQASLYAFLEQTGLCCRVLR